MSTNKNKKRPLRIGYNTLERMVPRAAQVVLQYENDPAVRLVARRVVPAGEAFRLARVASVNSEVERATSLQTLREQAETLDGMLSKWIPACAAEYGVVAATFRPETNVVDDVVGAAKRLCAWLETKRGTEPAAETMQALETISAQVALVEAMSASARATAAETQRLAQASREKAIEFHKRLVAFRRVLASVVGQHSRDYQSLRYRKVRQTEETDEILDLDEPKGDDATAASSTPAASSGLSVVTLGSGEVAAE